MMQSDPTNSLNLLRGKHVLVTGAAGFIGLNLIRKLLEYDCRIIGLDRPSADRWRIKDILSKIQFIEQDLYTLDPAKLKPQLSNTQIIYHLAADFPAGNEADNKTVLQANIVGTSNMLQLANRLGVERFVNCGSCFEYGNGSALSENTVPAPIDEYGVSKTAALMIGNVFYKKYGVPVISLRPFTAYGPFEARQRLIPHTILCALDSVDIELTEGKQKRDLVFIDDIVDAFLTASISEKGLGEVFNISTGKETSVKEFVLSVISKTDSKTKPLFGARPYRESEFWSLSGDPSKMQNQLGWSARYSLEDGLNKTIEWFRENRDKYPEYSAGKK